MEFERDLLVRLDQKLDFVLSSLERKADSRDVADLSLRVKSLEKDSTTMKGNWKFVVGVVVALQAAGEFFLHVFWKTSN